jgi:hypothetical protein
MPVRWVDTLAVAEVGTLAPFGFLLTLEDPHEHARVMTARSDTIEQRAPTDSRFPRAHRWGGGTYPAATIEELNDHMRKLEIRSPNLCPVTESAVWALKQGL